MQEDAAKKVSKKQVKKQVVKKQVTKKKKTKPKITLTGKPSCKSCCKQSYTWRTRTYVNYCPNCKHYNCLLKNPKGVPERELTCKRCSSDFCVCGHDKSGGKRHYTSILTRE